MAPEWSKSARTKISWPSVDSTPSFTAFKPLRIDDGTDDRRAGVLVRPALAALKGPPYIRCRESLSLTKKRITFETVRKIGLALPDVEEGTSHGSPALKVRGKMFTCVPIHRSAEADSLAIRLDFAQRDELIAAEPGIYYLPD